MQRGIKGLLLGMMLGFLGCLFGLSPYGIAFEKNTGLDWLFTTRGTIKPPPGIAVIAVDGFTGEKLGFPELPREWPRSIHGELVDALVDLGASTIVFDIDFHKQRSVEDEQVFANAIKRSERVVLLQNLTGKGKQVEDKSSKSQADIWVEKLLSPVPVLSEVARGLGPFPLPQSEASVFEFWVFKSSAQEIPTIPAVGLQIHALRAYDQFYRLLNDSGLADFMELPGSASEITTVQDVHYLMTGIRNVLSEMPELGEKLINESNKSWVNNEAEETRRLLRSLVSMYLGGDKRLLNFYGPPGTVETIPYQTIIPSQASNPGEEDPDLADKVVFVGYSDRFDPSQPDGFYTVFTTDQGVDLSGVEITATAFGNLLYEQSLQILEVEYYLLILFIFGLFVSSLIYYTPAILSVPASVIVVAGYAFFVQTLFSDSYLWLPLATPVLIQFPVALFIGLSAQYLQQRHKAINISDAISLYVPEEISKSLTSDDFKLESTDQVAFSTCLATDMEGFATIAEKMNPGEAAAFLNDYFETLAKTLRDFDVTVTEFRADSIMCAWTGHESDIELRKKPIFASLKAADAIEEFKIRHDEFKSPLRIGLETGEVFVGHSGGGGHFVYSIVGDCANTASRVEGLNKLLGTQILATESVVEGVGNLLIRPLGRFVFLGKTEPVSIVEILNLPEQATQKQIELCERFASAIDLFFTMNWRAASMEFESIQGEFPLDGPCRFYISECQERINTASLADDAFIINLTSK